MSEPKWLREGQVRRKLTSPVLQDEVAPKKIQKAVREQEDRVARAMGGRRMPASGSLPFLKGDVDNGIFKSECKLTVRKQLSLKAAWFEKITREARLADRRPALTFQLLDPPPGVSRDWVCIPVDDFGRLLQGAGVKAGLNARSDT